jgi:serine protease Do
MTPNPSTHPSFDTDTLADAVQRLAGSVVGLSMRRGAASGVVWSPGVVATGEIRGLDTTIDLAAVSFDAPTSPPPPERANGESRAGDFVFAVGREPSGRVQASFGHVGAAGGEWRTWRGGRVEQFIRLDGGLYPGMTGAPVADAAGRVLGVASPMLSRHHGVVLPGATIDRVLAQLLTHGHARQGYIGIAAQPVRATIDGLATDGLLVSSVADDGPAAKAGLLVGDVIVEVGGQAVASIEALRARLAGEAVGSSLALKVARGGQAMQLTIEIAERPTRDGLNGHCCR